MTIPPPATHPADPRPPTPTVVAGPRPAATGIRPAADALAVDGVHEAAVRAAQGLFGGRAIKVDSFFDEGSSRLVYRVADRFTGQILVETPPEELLRFYANSRRASQQGETTRPLLAVEA